MAIGDIKTYNYVYTGLELQVDAIDLGSSQTKLVIKCISGSADVNALFWNDFILDTLQFDLGVKSLNMNGTGVDWDGGIKLSEPGLGRAGVDKATYLTVGESYTINSVALNWLTLNDMGVRATSTSTAEGSIKGVDTEATITLGPPKISIHDATASESDLYMTFQVTMDHAYTEEIIIPFHTFDGSAISSHSSPPGDDYFGLEGGFYMIMPAGQTSSTIDIPLHPLAAEDTVHEDTENFFITLDSTTYGTIVQNFATGTILDDDNDIPPQISIGDASVAEGGTLQFNISLDHAVDYNVTTGWHMNFRPPGVAEGGGVDYDYPPGPNLMIPAGQLSAVLEVNTIDDGVVEGNEDFYVDLDGASVAVADGRGIGTIIDNDPPQPVNHAPVAVDDQLVIAEAANSLSTKRINLFANDMDPDGDAFTITAIGWADGSVKFGTFDYGYNSSTGELLYVVFPSVVPLGEIMQDQLKYTITDQNGASSTAFVNVLIYDSTLGEPPAPLTDTLGMPI